MGIVISGLAPTANCAKTVVDLAVATPDLSTLVAALKAGGLVSKNQLGTIMMIMNHQSREPEYKIQTRSVPPARGFGVTIPLRVYSILAGCVHPGPGPRPIQIARIG